MHVGIKFHSAVISIHSICLECRIITAVYLLSGTKPAGYLHEVSVVTIIHSWQKWKILYRTILSSEIWGFRGSKKDGGGGGSGGSGDEDYDNNDDVLLGLDAM